MFSLFTLTVVLLFAYLTYHYLIFPLSLSRLASIPSPHWSCKISPLWFCHKRFTFHENRSLQSAFTSLGPVVRVGPNEVAINFVEGDGGVRTVYGGGWEKHDWYPNLFHNYSGIANMFSTAHSKPHAQRKRMLSNIYAKSSVQGSKGFARACEAILLKRMVPFLRSCISNNKHHKATGSKAAGSIDLYQLLNYTTMDIVTAYMFGLRCSSNFLQNHEAGDRWLDLYSSRKKFVFWPQEMPGLTNFLARVGIELSPQWVADANGELEDWCMKMCEAAAAVEDEAEEKSPGLESERAEDVPNVHRQLRNALDAEKNYPGRPPAKLTIASEMLDQLSAGHETSAITLAYLFHELIQHPKLQERLRAEMLTVQPALRQSSGNGLPLAKVIDALPLLHATLMETLRLHPAIPGPQPRVTPATKDGSGVSIGPYGDIPAGVRVSGLPYCLHRNPEVFEDPEAWNPDRWLDADEVKKAEMHRWFWAFSSGGRMCIGSNLAMHQMKLVTAVLIANFDFLRVLDDNAALGGMEQEDIYTAPPRGGKLVVEVTEA